MSEHDEPLAICRDCGRDDNREGCQCPTVACEHCGEDVTAIYAHETTDLTGHVHHYCDDECASSYAEAAWERSLSRYYGGSTASDAERMASYRSLKR